MDKLNKKDKYEELSVEIQELKEFKMIHKGRMVDLGSGKSVLEVQVKMWNKWIDTQILKLTKQRLKYT